MKPVLVRMFVVVLFALLAAPASATVIISNLDPFASTSGGTAFRSSVGADRTKDFGWTMGADSYLFDSADLRLNFYGPEDDPKITIWSGASAPATQLGVLNNPTAPDPGPGQITTFTATNTIAMAANTTYWIRVELGDPTGDFTWYGAPNAPTGIATAVGYLFDAATGLGSMPSSNTNSVRINGTLFLDVPEPATLSLFGLGLAALGIAGRRRRAA